MRILVAFFATEPALSEAEGRILIRLAWTSKFPSYLAKKRAT
jgi:hypothetical protein